MKHIILEYTYHIKGGLVCTNDEIWNKILKNKNNSPDLTIENYVDKLVKTRNYYTHGNPKNLNEYVIKDSIEIIETTLLLNQITKYYICKELFILDDEFIDIINKHSIKYYV